MDASPLFSVTIPAYMDAELLGLTLNSVLSQGVKDVEVVVCDDSSSNELRALVAATGDRRVRYIPRKTTAGAVANWNFCLEQCRGRYVILLHHDERFAHDGCLAEIARTFREKRAQVVVSSLCLESPRDIRPLGMLREAMRRIAAAASPEGLLIYNAVGPVSVLALDADAARVRFNESLRWFVDVEYYTRLFKGRRVRVCPKSLLVSRLVHRHRISTNLDVARAEREERPLVLKLESRASCRILLRVGWMAYDAARRLKRLLRLRREPA